MGSGGGSGGGTGVGEGVSGAVGLQGRLASQGSESSAEMGSGDASVEAAVLGELEHSMGRVSHASTSPHLSHLLLPVASA